MLTFIAFTGIYLAGILSCQDQWWWAIPFAVIGGLALGAMAGQCRHYKSIGQEEGWW